jgi:hypothetical protein
MSKGDQQLTDNTTKFLYAFTQKVLNSDRSIRWVAITDEDGIILNEQNREGYDSLLTNEENQESAMVFALVGLRCSG